MDNCVCMNTHNMANVAYMLRYVRPTWPFKVQASKNQPPGKHKIFYK